jgi:hypothetical protein
MTLHRRDYKVVETPQGVGHVLQEGREVAKVSYSLFVEMQVVGTKSFGIPVEKHLQRKSVRGKISILDGYIPLAANPSSVSGPFTLVLQDGRKVDFYIPAGVTKPHAAKELEIEGSGSRL